MSIQNRNLAAQTMLTTFAPVNTYGAGDAVAGGVDPVSAAITAGGQLVGGLFQVLGGNKQNKLAAQQAQNQAELFALEVERAEAQAAAEQASANRIKTIAFASVAAVTVLSLTGAFVYYMRR